MLCEYKESKTETIEKRERIRPNPVKMGSSSKAKRHYKKDSRFVKDLYTFTYDDFDLVKLRYKLKE